MSAVEPFEIMPDIDTQSALEKHLKSINRQVRSVGMLTMKEYRRAYRLWCHELMPLAKSRRHAAPIDFDDAGMERCFTLAPDFSDAIIAGDEEKAAQLAMEIARVVESCIAKCVRNKVADIMLEREGPAPLSDFLGDNETAPPQEYPTASEWLEVRG